MRGIHWLPGSVLSAFTPAVVPAMASVMRGAASAHSRRRRGREQRDGGHLAPTVARYVRRTIEKVALLLVPLLERDGPAPETRAAPQLGHVERRGIAAQMRSRAGSVSMTHPGLPENRPQCRGSGLPPDGREPRLPVARQSRRAVVVVET
jgi:hypothetical protein